MRHVISGATLVLALALAAVPFTPAAAQSKNFAPGFDHRAPGTRIVVVPPDLELFELSAGGVVEPRADWTGEAQKFLRGSLEGHGSLIGERVKDLTEADMDEFAQVNALHAAVAQSINLHHMIGGAFALPTKDGKMDWSLGDAVQPLREKTGADYALFFWIRDSYASAERKAAMVLLALAGVGISGGVQIGYASLVDLRDGRVVWFNRLARASGDLREQKSADETLDALLMYFPPVK